MTTNQRVLGGNWPVTLLGVQVSVADTGMGNLDETLAGLELVGLNDLGLVVNLDGISDRGDDGSSLSLGDRNALKSGHLVELCLEFGSKLSLEVLSRKVPECLCCDVCVKEGG